MVNKYLWHIRQALDLNGNPIKQFKLAGYDITLDTTEEIQRCVYTESLEPTETKWVMGTLKPGMVFVDAGANIGYYSLIASSLVGDNGRVYAFEPSDAPYNALARTIKRNMISNIIQVHSALGDTHRRKEMFKSNANNIDSPSFVYHNTKSKEESTSIGFKEIISLDVYCQSSGIESIDLIKIDVEGYEPQALAGMTRMLHENRVGRIIIELSNTYLYTNDSSSEALDALLAGFGFEVKATKKYDDMMSNVFYTNPDVVKK